MSEVRACTDGFGFPGLTAAPQTRTNTFTARALTCIGGTGEWSPALRVRHPLWYWVWGCCGGVLLTNFAEKNIIYLKLSQCCVVLCQRGLLMVYASGLPSQDVYRLAEQIQVRNAGLAVLLLRGVSPGMKELPCTPLCQPAASWRLSQSIGVWTQNHAEPTPRPQTRILEEKTGCVPKKHPLGNDVWATLARGSLSQLTPELK